MVIVKPQGKGTSIKADQQTMHIKVGATKKKKVLVTGDSEAR